VAASDERYDIILFTMIDSWSGAAAGGSYVFNENSLYTIEAVRDYMSHLEPWGILSMSRYYRWAEGLRLTNMFIEHLAEGGVADPSRRIVVLRKEHPRPVVTVLLKNGEFTRDEVDTIALRTARGGASVLYAPYLPPSDFAEPPISSPYRALIRPESYGETRASLIRSHPRNLAPATDDRPFFFFTTRPLDVFRMDRRDHAARKLALPLLYGMAIVFGAIGLLTVFLPLALRSREGLRSAPRRTRSLVYFAMLGTGFMLVEISLIQRLTIFLGHPTWSFVAVLSSMLLSGGLGSLYSTRWSRGSPEVLAAAIAGVVALLLLCALVLYDRFIDLMWLSMPVRVVLAVATIVPPGFLMGMCFPMGIQIARELHETLVPWGWGVNGAFSVFASVLAFVLALNAGFKVAMIAGIACYAVALLIVLTFRDERRGPSATTA
jgi:hypothetical protein